MTVMERGKARRRPNLLADDRRARLLGGFVSSGSDHDADIAGVLDGIFFSDEEDCDAAGDDGRDDRDPSPPPAATVAIVRGLLNQAATDPFAAAVAERTGGPAPPRAVMGRLREAGYDAGLCKARWEEPNGVRGSYEYVDVVQEGTWQRYVVEPDFKGQFEIARPTAEYEEVVAGLPRVFVGRPDELRRLVRLLADAAKRSLQRRELHVPPWRKSGYMQAKWLGPYRRTTNPVKDAKCRSTGFWADGSHVVCSRGLL